MDSRQTCRERTYTLYSKAIRSTPTGGANTRWRYRHGIHKITEPHTVLGQSRMTVHNSMGFWLFGCIMGYGILCSTVMVRLRVLELDGRSGAPVGHTV